MTKRRKKAKVLARRRADANHEVTTILGSSRLYRRVPCQECPWRQDSKVGAFPAEAYRISATTAYDMAGNSFGCHMAGLKEPVTCAGFLLRGSHHNMGVRLAVLNKEIDLDLVSDGGAELYDSYRDMAVANGVALDDPALRRCR